MLLYWLLVVILKFGIVFGDEEHRRVIRQNGQDTCTMEDNTAGTCINIRKCPSLLNLLQTRAQEPPVKAYLRKLRCGTENNKPKVCCPKTGGIVIPPLTAASPITPTPPITAVSPITPTPPITAASPITPTPLAENVTNGDVVGRIDGTSDIDYSKCGKSDRKGIRIIGGQNATLGDWPWMVVLGYRTYRNPGPLFQCGGSLISNQWVLTAAHCINLGSMTLTTVRVGDLNLNDTVEDNATPIDVPVDTTIPHPDYSRFPLVNDIALVRLRNPVTFTKLIRPICLLTEATYRSDGFYHRKMPFIMGWGSTEHHGPTTTILQEAQVSIVDNDQCAQDYNNNQRQTTIDERVLCAGSGGKDSCQGDSGGPLIIPVGSTYRLAGIVSFGIGCGDEKYPGVYTRVAYFADWIKRMAGV